MRLHHAAGAGQDQSVLMRTAVLLRQLAAHAALLVLLRPLDRWYQQMKGLSVAWDGKLRCWARHEQLHLMLRKHRLSRHGWLFQLSSMPKVFSTD
jgi:hypothetical protein